MNARCANLTGCALILWFSAVLLSGCQPIVLPPAPVVIPTAASEPVAKAAPIQIPEKAVVIDEAGPITATDPAQAQAEAEFRALVIAKEEAFYAGDFEELISYYADDVISVQPGWPETVGKAALSEGLQPYVEDNRIVGTFILKKVWIDGDRATRFGEWEEVVTSKEGGAAEYHIGRCILNWEKIDGEWKVVSEFVNYLVPPTEMEQ